MGDCGNTLVVVSLAISRRSLRRGLHTPQPIQISLPSIMHLIFWSTRIKEILRQSQRRQFAS